jgi:iron complex transport system permease protein
MSASSAPARIMSDPPLPALRASATSMPPVDPPTAFAVPPADAAADASSRGPALLALALAGVIALALVAGLAAGSEGWSLHWSDEWTLVSQIRAPRSGGALLAGALLGLGGAVAQGLFRNPLADPYLLGSAAGAGLGVVLVLAAGGALGALAGPVAVGWLMRVGLVGAAFAGALGGVLLTLVLARGAARPMVLLLCGVVVGVLAGAASDLVVLLAPEALRGRQAFMLGTTGFVGWDGVAVLAAALAVTLPFSQRLARALDALVLGEATAASLGLDVPRQRLVLVVLMALAIGTAVAQTGLVAFVGLVAPHLVRRGVVVTHALLLPLSALSGGALLLVADVAARTVVAPQELPVGVLTALCGGAYLLALLSRDARRAR